MDNQVLAVVAGKEITEKDFQAFAHSLPKDQQAYLQNPEAKKYFEEQFIGLYLFAQSGTDDKLEESAEYKKIMDDARRDVLAQMAMQNLLSGIDVTEEEMKAYYEEHKDQFQASATAHAKHILMESEDKLKDVLAKITNGEVSFEDAAKEHSTCPSGAQGGDLGEFGRGQMVKEFEDAAFEEEIGKIVGPVKTQFGYHLIKVEGRKEAQTQPYEEVVGNIHKTLLQEKQNKVYSEKIAELKAKYCK